jgi:hypothetical protein
MDGSYISVLDKNDKNGSAIRRNWTFLPNYFWVHDGEPKRWNQGCQDHARITGWHLGGAIHVIQFLIRFGGSVMMI